MYLHTQSRKKQKENNQLYLDTYSTTNTTNMQCLKSNTNLDTFATTFDDYSNDYVRAHYTICIQAYLLDVTVIDRLRKAQVEDVGSVRKVYSTLGRCEVVKLGVKGTKCEGRKLMHVTDVQKSIMELFNCKYLKESGYSKSIGIK